MLRQSPMAGVWVAKERGEGTESGDLVYVITHRLLQAPGREYISIHQVGCQSNGVPFYDFCMDE